MKCQVRVLGRDAESAYVLKEGDASIFRGKQSNEMSILDSKNEGTVFFETSVNNLPVDMA